MQKYNDAPPEPAITNHSVALALYYDGVHAPQITAKEYGDVADQLIAIAHRHGILIHEDPALCRVLATLSLGDEIPDSLYITIAKIIAFAYWLNDKQPT